MTRCKALHFSQFEGGRREPCAKFQGSRTHMRDALKHEPAGSGVDQIDDVVHGAAEQVDVGRTA